MSYRLYLLEKAKKELREYEQTNNKQQLIKIRNLFEELKEHPTTGTGKIKPLRHNRSGFWSRRIDQEHRMVYMIDDKKQIVEIHALKYHYEE
jgi:toxin YoeB